MENKKVKKKVPSRRNGFYYKDNNLTRPYVSVTKVLGDTLAKPALYYWSGREACRIALRNPELNGKEVMAELALYVKGTQQRGKTLHNAAECFATAHSIPTVAPELQGYLNALQSWWLTHNLKTIKTELEVYSDTLMVAGRLDYLCEIEGKQWLIDFKTGRQIYKEVGLQLAFYKYALKEFLDIEVDKMGVVLLKEDSGFIFQETTDTIEDFEKVLAVWRWLKKKGE